MNYPALLDLLVLALAIATVSMTISKTYIFRALRDFLEERSEWLEKLFSCPYCLSHWLSFAAVALYQPRPIESGFLIVDLAVSAFAVVCLSAWFGGLIFRAFRE